MFLISSLLTLTLTTFTIATSPLVNQNSRSCGNGSNYTTVDDPTTGSTLSFVTNSGICETTPEVNQYSGYISLGNNMSMWFWFFEARSNPSIAPLALWLSGGPGCSSMIGLFQENGPCTFNNVTGPNPVLNPYSWNNYANMLYVDQPIGTGFSYGNGSTNSTPEAAQVTWTFLQAFYTHFSNYQNRDFALFTESYGGHYGPNFAKYFESQNVGIDQGVVTGIKIRMTALGINDGWFDPSLQFKALIDYGVNNPYRVLFNASFAAELYQSYNDSCGPALQNCSISDSDDDCAQAAVDCIVGINVQAATIDFDPYDIRQGANTPFPPITYMTYLQDSDIQMRIGAQVQFQNCSIPVFNNFIDSGDYARSFLTDLSDVVQTGIHVLLWGGEDDWLANVAGVEEVIAEIKFDQSAEFNAAPLSPFTIEGTEYGRYKTAGNLSYLRVFNAGHQASSFQPKLAQEVFRQTINLEVLYST